MRAFLQRLFFLLFSLIAFLLIFYGGYYFFVPSRRGAEILSSLNIPYPTIIAHRGSSYSAPESTVHAYEAARDEGADYLEADIQRTKDGTLIVLHDSTLTRTSNVAEVFPERQNDHVSTFSLGELEKLDFGSWFNRKYPERAKPKYAGSGIVTLEMLLIIAEQSVQPPGVVLDLKNTAMYDNMAQDIIDLLKKRGWYTGSGHTMIYNRNSPNDRSPVIIFSFDRGILKTFKEIAPSIPRSLLVNDKMINIRKWDYWLNVAEETANGLGVNGLVSWPWYIALAHKRQLFVYPYTITKGWQFSILSHLDSNGYITNRPEKVIDFISHFPRFAENKKAD